MDNEQGKFMGTILDSIADGVFTININKEITSFNRAAERITGFSRSEALGRKCYEIFNANICQGECALEKTLADGDEIIDLPITIINKEGKMLPVSISTGTLRDENGNVAGGVETFRDLSIIEELKKEINKNYTYEDIVSKNHEIQTIFKILPDIADSESTVLIEGPSGSGKELFARAIHNISKRKNGPYVTVNCGALPDTLLESELFGYVEGAFTDAKKDKPGRFALAEGGTIFLDEVADISKVAQVKILRVLQEKEYEPLGASKTVKANVRVIAATNRKLLEEVNEGRFRSDLYYRLNVVRLELPLLKKRREDIPLLIEHFVNRFNLKMGKNIIGVTDDAMYSLMRYDYPGNIRELENIIEHAFVLCRATRISRELLPPEVTMGQEHMPEKVEEGVSPLQSAESETIRNTLEENNGNRTRTAESLGISKATLWRKMKKYGLD